MVDVTKSNRPVGAVRFLWLLVRTSSMIQIMIHETQETTPRLMHSIPWGYLTRLLFLPLISFFCSEASSWCLYLHGQRV
ncbi:hypothetical protein BDV27DRAFT_5561 [Aspergillus caelatus]|uniref:Uncharacterized protein n=1 Tax=Aspergillus caelatus TaxID=61420 RepID=A0A5N7AHY1_9EURO|nr:uncharacterized protein BDV27DRAFT_5561 [Aspergillus caelatus]KAE8369472.1 hypothetical protein BDV27DRAFT_5561 [Aspergillus caelatus]